MVFILFKIFKSCCEKKRGKKESPYEVPSREKVEIYSESVDYDLPRNEDFYEELPNAVNAHQNYMNHSVDVSYEMVECDKGNYAGEAIGYEEVGFNAQNEKEKEDFELPGEDFDADF